jgi:cell shape-determining protein MreC
MSDVTEKELNDFDDCIREVDEIEEQRKTNRNLLGKLEHLKQERDDLKEENTRYRLYIELINRHTETALKEKQ